MTLDLVPLDPDLVRAFDEGDLILCVGPAPSLAAGLPSHEALAASLLEFAVGLDGSIDGGSLRAAIDQGRASEVLELLDHRLGVDFQREVERRLSDQGRQPPALVSSIAKLRKQLRAIYTTRLDRLIERSLAGRWPSFSAARPDLAQRRSLVFKLRGTLEFPQSWVLTREQEEREFAGGSARHTVVETAYRAHELLLLGFEPGSHELERLLAMMPVRSDGQGPSHYIVAPNCDALERQKLERRGLRVLDIDPQALLDGLAGQTASESRVMPSGQACPYPGLEAFTEDRAELFFGRHAEVSQAASMLGGLGGVDHRWLSIEGPSGVGKSSFARAGVVPALRAGFAEGTPSSWRVAIMRPSTTPILNLMTAVCGAIGVADVASQVEQLRASPRHLAELIRRASKSEGLLLLVDQLEEIVTIAPEADRVPFGEAITRALDSRVLYLVTTTRSDLIPALQRGLPSLAGLLNEFAQRYALPPISRVGLREAICEPARKAGVTIAPELVEKILVDADRGQHVGADQGTLTTDATLPLVAHVLRGLWTDENVADGIISLDEYVAMGGIAGALSRSADGLVSSLGAGEQQLARELMLRLIRLQPDGTATRRVVELSEARQVGNDMVIQALSGGRATATGAPSVRLVVVHDEQGHSELELVHEALIRDWATFKQWIEQGRTQLLLDDELSRAAAKWKERGAARKDLPSGRDATELLGGRPHGSAEQQAQQREFQAALQSVRRRRKWVLGGTAVTVLALAVGFVSMLEVDEDTCSVSIDGGPTIEHAVVISSGEVVHASLFGHTTMTYPCDSSPSKQVRAPGSTKLAMIVVPSDQPATVVVEDDQGKIWFFVDVRVGQVLDFADARPGLPASLGAEQLEQLVELVPTQAMKALVESRRVGSTNASSDAAEVNKTTSGSAPASSSTTGKQPEPAAGSGDAGTDAGADAGTGADTGTGTSTDTSTDTGTDTGAAEPEEMRVLYRLFDVSSSNHLFTIDETERNPRLEEGWLDEGSFVLFGTEAPDRRPLVRLYNADHTVRMVTSRPVELIEQGWVDEGIVGYVHVEVGTPFFVLIRKQEDDWDSVMTTNPDERENLIEGGWVELEAQGFLP